MASKNADAGEVPRKGMSMRLADNIRALVERSAEHHNRTIGSDIEHRLNASFKLEFVNSSGLSSLLSNKSATDFISSLGSVLDGVTSICREREFSEIETRKALRAAIAVLISRHLWVGEDMPSTEGSADTKVRDLPPIRLGHRWATDHLDWDAAWSDRAVVEDTMDGRVANRWTGDGSVIELGEPPKPKSAPRDLTDVSLEEVEADLASDDPKNLHLYKRLD